MRSSDQEHPHRRSTDHWRGKIAIIWRSVVPILALVIAGYAVIIVQQQRREAIRIQCKDQNIRHQIAEDGLRTNPIFKPRQKLTEAEEARRQAALKTFAQLMIPKRDCERVVKQLAP